MKEATDGRRDASLSVCPFVRMEYRPETISNTPFMSQTERAYSL